MLYNNLYLSFTIINISVIIKGDFIKKIIEIDGMTCNHGVKAVEMELKELQPDSILVEIGKAEIESNFDKLNINAINNAIAEPCYSVIEK